MRVPSASTSVLKRMPSRACSLNLPPRSTCITDPIARAPAGIATWSPTLTSRVTRASTRSSTRAVSLDTRALGLQSDHRVGRDDVLRERARRRLRRPQPVPARRARRRAAPAARSRRRGAGGGGGCGCAALLAASGAGSRCATVGGRGWSCAAALARAGGVRRLCGARLRSRSGRSSAPRRRPLSVSWTAFAGAPRPRAARPRGRRHRGRGRRRGCRLI